MSSLLGNMRSSLGFGSDVEQRSKETLPVGTGKTSRLTWMNPSTGRTGIPVTAETSLTYSAIYSAVTLLVSTCCSLPLKKYRKRDNGDIEEKHDLYTYLLNFRPNPEMDSRTYNEVMEANLLLRGNAYAEKEFNDLDEVIALWPIPAQYMYPVRMDDGSIWYAYIGPTGIRKLIPGKKILHVKDFSLDGFQGLSRVSQARLGIELGLSQEALAVNLMVNDGRPSGVIETPNELDDDTLEEFKEEWRNTGSGITEKGKTIILEKGMIFKPISLSPKDTEFVLSRNFQVQEIARWFRVPPHMLYDLTRSTYSNIEKQSQDFATYSLLPILDRFIFAYMFDFYIEKDIIKVMRNRLFKMDVMLEYDLSSLLRADVKTRHEVYNLGSSIGMYSINDNLRAERKDTIGKDGDIRTIQNNRIPLSQVEANGTAKAGKTSDNKSSGDTGNGQKP
jgi:HK97 family phage portal protein